MSHYFGKFSDFYHAILKEVWESQFEQENDSSISATVGLMNQS